MNGGMLSFSRGTERQRRRVVHDYVLAEQKLPLNTHDGDPPSINAWFTQDLNTLTADESGIARLTSNRLFIPAGEYRVQAAVHGMHTNGIKCRIYDTKRPRTLASSNAPYAKGGSFTCQTYCALIDTFILDQDAAIELQGYVQANPVSGWGLGHYGSLSDPETFCHLELLRVRA